MSASGAPQIQRSRDRAPVGALRGELIGLLVVTLGLASYVAFPPISYSAGALKFAVLGPAAVCGVILAAATPFRFRFVARFYSPSSPMVTRPTAALRCLLYGARLGGGMYLICNGLLDREPVRWVTYTFEDDSFSRGYHLLGLRFAGEAGYPKHIWIPFGYKPVPPVRSSVEIPIRPAALGTPWVNEMLRCAR